MRLVAKTKTELLAKMAEAQKAIDTGLEVSSAYTVGQCLDDFLAAGLEGLAPNTIDLQTRMRWEDNDLVFCTRLGRPVDRGNIARAFKTICANAGVEDAANRVPYEMRHTYASLIHDDGVPAGEIAQELGHSGTRVFEAVYRHVLRPQRLTGQMVMDRIAAQRTG